MNTIYILAKNYLRVLSVLYVLLGMAMFGLVGKLIALGPFLIVLTPYPFTPQNLQGTYGGLGFYFVGAPSSPIIYFGLHITSIMLGVLGIIALARIEKSLRWIWVWYGLSAFAIVIMPNSAVYVALLSMFIPIRYLLLLLIPVGFWFWFFGRERVARHPNFIWYGVYGALVLLMLNILASMLFCGVKTCQISEIHSWLQPFLMLSMTVIIHRRIKQRILNQPTL